MRQPSTKAKSDERPNGRNRRRSSLSTFAVAVSLALSISLGLAATAGAAAPDLLLRMPDGKTAPGSGAGELDNPRAAAGDPVTGHVYVSDLNNNRIGEYTAWGAFVKAWGWDVAPDGAPGDTPSDQLEVCTTVCKAGTAGSGPGQGGGFRGIAVDTNGDIYVLQNTLAGDLRVQKFSSDGEFLLMFGGEVNKTTGADVCTNADLEGGDECGEGVAGTGDAEFSSKSVGNYITYNAATDTIFVGDVDRIQEFETDGIFKAQIPFEGALEAFDGQTARSLASDPAGNLYLSLQPTGFSTEDVEDIYKLSPGGEPLAPGKPGESKFEVPKPRAVAVDGDGTVYAVEGPGGNYVLGFDANGNPIEGMEAKDEFARVETEVFPQLTGPDINGAAVNQCAGSKGPNFYVVRFSGGFGGLRSYISAYGPGPIGCEDPPLNPPLITDQYAVEVSRDDALLKGEINPRFWADTTYHVQYGAGKCTEGGCEGTSAEAVLTDKVTNAQIATAGVFLGGLEPGTTYHYRFLAKSSGGGPAFSEERTFTTFAAAVSPEPCANDQFRGGHAAKLPDCRAYEMVSPLDKDNGDAALWIGRNNAVADEMEIDQSAPSGNRFTYTSSTAFADSQSAAFVSQYLAERSAAGWASKGISAPRTFSPVPATSTFLNEFDGFSENLCSGWLRNYSMAPLAASAVPKYTNLYRRDNCAERSSYEALTTVQPPNRPAESYSARVRGFSDDGSHTVFSANGRLHPDAPALGQEAPQLYEQTEGELRFVCYLPNGNPSPLPCSLGTDAVAGADFSSKHNAVSADGSRIYWTAYSGGINAHPGTIYLRLGGQETVKVSSLVSPDPAYFWTAAEDGSRAIFTFASGPLKDEVYEFDLAKALAEEPGATRLVAKGAEGPMGASEDASRVYFSSSEDLDSGGAGSKGAHNLYLHEADAEGGAGTTTFIMALSAEDVNSPNDVGNARPRQVPISLSPGNRGARVSPDGSHVVFPSTAGPTPTGYDNRDVSSGEPVSEVYRYDAEAKELRCISCNPSGVRPAGGPGAGGASGIKLAARIQGWELNQHAPHVLSEDGSRVFFESYEALVPEDTNGALDVYQWQKPGKGSCTKATPTFGEASGGCVDLISAGKSPRQSIFLDADPSGENIFFGTLSSLVGADFGLNDVYVARVGGGFPEAAQRSGCEGESCQSPSSAPVDATPASAVFKGQGNPNPRRPRSLRCKAPKRKVRRGGKARCVKKRGGNKAKKRAGNQRRAGR